MRNRLLRLFTALTACCLMLAFATPGMAQVREFHDQYGRVIIRLDVNTLVRRAENRSDQFVRVLERTRSGGFFERIFDRDRQDRVEDRVAAQARHLEGQLNAIRNEFETTGDYYTVRSQVANSLFTARRINNIMARRQLSYQAERQWLLLRADMNRLARAFRLSTV